MDTNLIKHQIESLLFVSNKPVAASYFAKILNVDVEHIKEAAKLLQTEKKSTGVVLLEAKDEYQLATHPDNSNIVKNFLNADLRERLTDATVEVLTIIAYRGPITRAEIEAIRGVNSQYSLRQLLMRGLIDKNSGDGRGLTYQVTTDFLQQLGLQSVTDLPQYSALSQEIKLPNIQQKPMQETNTQNLSDPQLVGGVDITEPELPAPDQLPELPPAEPSVPQPSEK